MKLVRQGERYFWKKARGDFFEKYRHMSSTKMSFAKPVMTRNDDQVWENVALLSEEEKRERTRKYRGPDIESGPRSQSEPQPSPINVLLSGRVPMGDLTTRSHTGSLAREEAQRTPTTAATLPAPWGRRRAPGPLTWLSSTMLWRNSTRIPR